MNQLLRLGRSGVLLGAVIGLAQCGGSDILLPIEARPSALTKFEGDDQRGPAGTALPKPVVVKVVNQRGDPLVGQKVSFTPGEGTQGVRLNPDVASTNDEGLAQAEWILGQAAGIQSIVAGMAGDPDLTVTFVATAQPGAPRRIEEVEGNQQDGTVGGALRDPLVIHVTDEFGNPVEGVEVEWSAENGSVDPASSTTGPDGRASTSWTLGSSPGSQTAVAASRGLDGSPVAFTADAAPGGPRRLVQVSGNNQTAGINQELGQPLVVRLEDADGNGVPGRAVSWVVGSGGGDVSATTSTTDAEGRAQVRWRVGGSAGLNTLNAVVSGVGFVTFRAFAARPDGGGNGGDDGSGGDDGNGGQGGDDGGEGNGNSGSGSGNGGGENGGGGGSGGGGNGGGNGNGGG